MSEKNRFASSSISTSPEFFALMLREVTHRCANDLQLVTSLLKLQSRASRNEEVRQALEEAANRVQILAEARDRARKQEPTLEAALQHVCAALNSQAEPRNILISLEFATDAESLTDDQITCVALCVNELATNSIKHAFCDSVQGRIKICVNCDDHGALKICVDDDGAPFRNKLDNTHHGMGLELIRSLLRSVHGELREPEGQSKAFEIVLAPGPTDGATENWRSQSDQAHR